MPAMTLIQRAKMGRAIAFLDDARRACSRVLDGTTDNEHASLEIECAYSELFGMAECPAFPVDTVYHATGDAVSARLWLAKDEPTVAMVYLDHARESLLNWLKPPVEVAS